MRENFTAEGKTKGELTKMVADLASKLYRLEREKSLLRRALVSLGQGIVNYDIPSFRKKARELIRSVMARTDARRKKTT